MKFQSCLHFCSCFWLGLVRCPRVAVAHLSVCSVVDMQIWSSWWECTDVPDRLMAITWWSVFVLVKHCCSSCSDLMLCLLTDLPNSKKFPSLIPGVLVIVDWCMIMLKSTPQRSWCLIWHVQYLAKCLTWGSVGFLSAHPLSDDRVDICCSHFRRKTSTLKWCFWRESSIACFCSSAPHRLHLCPCPNLCLPYAALRSIFRPVVSLLDRAIGPCHNDLPQRQPGWYSCMQDARWWRQAGLPLLLRSTTTDPTVPMLPDLYPILLSVEMDFALSESVIPWMLLMTSTKLTFSWYAFITVVTATICTVHRDDQVLTDLPQFSHIHVIDEFLPF